MSFLKKKAPVLTINTLIGDGATLSGNLTLYGNVKIDGRVTGSIETDGDIVLADTAWVGGGLTGNNLYIEGEVVGSVTAEGSLVLGETARIGGDLTSRSLVADDGAVFQGKSVLHREETLAAPHQEGAEEPAASQQREPEISAASHRKEAEAPAARSTHGRWTSKRKMEEMPEPQLHAHETPEVSNISVTTISTSNQMDPAPKAPMTEEEEKEAFLRRFYASSTPDE